MGVIVLWGSSSSNRGNCPWGNCSTGVMVLGGYFSWWVIGCGVGVLRVVAPRVVIPREVIPRVFVPGSCPRGSCPGTPLVPPF